MFSATSRTLSFILLYIFLIKSINKLLILSDVLLAQLCIAKFQAYGIRKLPHVSPAGMDSSSVPVHVMGAQKQPTAIGLVNKKELWMYLVSTVHQVVLPKNSQ